MDSRQEHWNSIFSTTADPELGWYESDASQTLRLLDSVPEMSEPVIFLPGAGTSVLVDDLLARGARLILNDVSDEALRKLRERIGGRDGKVTWLLHDMARPLPPTLPPADVWIDRAVLHFLLDEGDIDGYFANLRAGVRPGGYALLAEFSKTGAPMCAGLQLHRYSVEELTERLGPEFEPVRREDYTYINPFGDPRPYIYALYRKKD